MLGSWNLERHQVGLTQVSGREIDLSQGILFNDVVQNLVRVSGLFYDGLAGVIS